MSRYVIRNGHVVDPASKVDQVMDIMIENGVIAQIGEIANDTKVDFELDVEGLHVFPGLIDCHVHFRDPGYTHKEDFESGSMAALAGGVTSVIQMPNTSPPLATKELIVEYTRHSPVHAYVAAAVTKGRSGKAIGNIDSLVTAGAVALTDDGSPIVSDDIMSEALGKSAEFGIRIMSHAENPELSAGGAIIKGEISEHFGVTGIDYNAESSMVSRDIDLARKTGGNLHICHVSTKKSVELIRKAKSQGCNITAEVTPHHLLLTDVAVLKQGAMAKMNPPLAFEEDRNACIQGLKDGTLDVVATDHAPHTNEEKSEGLDAAPFGVSGLEISFPLLYTYLVKRGVLTLSELIDRMSNRPARVFNLSGGGLIAGNVADIAIFDLKETFQIDPDMFYSKGKNTPFAGWNVYGKVRYTIVDGEFRFPF